MKKDISTRSRNLKITLDHAYGRRFEDCAAEFDIHTSRAHQIYVVTLKKLGLNDAPFLTADRIATEIHNRYSVRHSNDTDTPESFYRQLKYERLEDRQLQQENQP